jgi:uncharacterized protein YndB with AHSA1/START domain
MQATGSKRAQVTTPSDLDILITRDFAAPPGLVYQAWTTPELVARWWAGRRGAVTSVESDLQVGGRWRYAMQTADGHEIAFSGEYTEIVPGEKLVWTETFEQMPDAGATVNTATFTATETGTRLELLTACPSQEVRDGILQSGMETGMQEQMEILDELLPRLA